jgi:hypothetical protein
MRTFLVLLGFAISPVLVSGQSITGIWYSKDGTRSYTIYEKQPHWEAVLTKTRRNNDEAGKIILPALAKKGSKYKGIIHSPEENISTVVTIKHSNKNPDILYLKLRRLIIFPVKIRWYRSVNTTAEEQVKR